MVMAIIEVSITLIIAYLILSNAVGFAQTVSTSERSYKSARQALDNIDRSYGIADAPAHQELTSSVVESESATVKSQGQTRAAR